MSAPAAAVTVGTRVLDGGVSPVGAESALLVMNAVPVAWMVTYLMGAWFAAVGVWL